MSLPQDAESRRRIPWTANEVWKILALAVVMAFFAFPIGLVYGAWTIFQPAREPVVGPVSAYVVAGLLLCIGAGWRAVHRQRERSRNRSVLGSWTTCLLAALAAGSFGVWGANLTATVHTPAASVHQAAAVGTGDTAAPTSAVPVSSQTPPSLHVIPGSDPRTCGGGQPVACSGLLVEVYSQDAGYIQDINTLCQGVLADNADTNLVSDCQRYQQPGLNGQLAKTTESLDVVAQVVGLPPLHLGY